MMEETACNLKLNERTLAAVAGRTRGMQPGAPGSALHAASMRLINATALPRIKAGTLAAVPPVARAPQRQDFVPYARFPMGKYFL